MKVYILYCDKESVQPFFMVFESKEAAELWKISLNNESKLYFKILDAPFVQGINCVEQCKHTHSQGLWRHSISFVIFRGFIFGCLSAASAYVIAYYTIKWTIGK